MVIGIEWFVVQNLCMNVLILTLAARLARVRAKKRHILAASALGCAYAVCAYLPWGKWLLGLLPRTLICTVMTAMVCSARRMREIGRTLRVFGFVWLSTLLLGGTGAGVMYMLGASGYSPFAALITAVLGTTVLMFLTAQRGQHNVSPMVQLTVVCGSRAVRFSAVVDTGNVLAEPLSNLPVIVAEKAALCGLEEGRSMRCVPFASVGGEGMLYAFLPDRIRIDGRECDACIAVYDGSLCPEGHALIPGRCMEYENDRIAVGKGAASADGRRQRTLHRGQSDAARAVYAAGGGTRHGSAASGR